MIAFGFAPVVLLPVLAPVVAATIYGAARFRVKVEAELAVARDSIRITVHNPGRVKGTVHRLAILDARHERIELQGAGDSFEELALESRSSKVLVGTAPEGRDYRIDDTVVVGWGRHATRKSLRPVDKGFWPPGAPAGTLIRMST